MHNVVLFLQGLLIGMASIMPGVSGSVIALTFGIYDKVMYILTNKKIKDNFLYLFVLSCGVFFGIVLFGRFMLKVLRFKVIIYYCLLGIILSQIPALFKTVKKIMPIPLITSFICTYLISLLSNLSVKSYDYGVQNLKMFLGGVFFMIGKVFPGISSSFFLIILNIYKDVLLVMTNPLIIIFKFKFYFPFLLGSLLGLILSLKLIKILLEKYYYILYNSILGVVLESTVFLFPGFKFEKKYIIGLLLMLILFIIFTIANKKNTKN